MAFESALARAQAVLEIVDFKAEQVECLRAIWRGKDVMAVLPTGFGKSAIFQAVPFLLAHRDGVDSYTVLIITPINSIMMDQCKKLAAKKILACYLDFKCSGALAAESDLEEDGEISCAVDLSQVETGCFNLIHVRAHPESLLCNRGWLLLKRMQKFVYAIAIDEADNRPVAGSGGEVFCGFSRTAPFGGKGPLQFFFFFFSRRLNIIAYAQHRSNRKC